MKRRKIVALLCAWIMLFGCAYPMEGIVLVKAETTTQTASNGVTWQYEVVTNRDGSYAKITNVELAGENHKSKYSGKTGRLYGKRDCFCLQQQNVVLRK